jgi:hypothetical protein
MKLVAKLPVTDIDIGQNGKKCNANPIVMSVRLKSKQAYKAGKFCADIKPAQNADGVVFAMYTASRNPGDDCRMENWDELDLEWLAGPSHKGELETNVWHNRGGPGMTSPNAVVHKGQPTTEWASYCIEWTNGPNDDKGSVKFYVNGKELPILQPEKSSIDVKWRPMYGYFSIWGAVIDGWSGSVRNLKEDAFGFVKNVTFTGTP